MNQFSHTDEQGKASMVDVSHKKPQLRCAKASGRIDLQAETLRLIHENQLKKGDVLTVAQVAGIQAAKRTSDLIPLCHPLQIDKIAVQLTPDAKGVTCESLVKCTGPTGVEMEALTAVSIALLTIYDMCKAVDKSMIIREIKLTEKTKTDLPT
jgi:cyclic pyranopterin monophosphate synthase